LFLEINKKAPVTRAESVGDWSLANATL